MFRVQLPNRTKLTHVELRRSRSSQTIARPTLGTVLRTLFFDLTNEELSWQVVDGLTPSMRLDLARDICSSLHRSVAGFPRATVPSLTEHDRDHPYDLPGHVDVHLTPPELAKAMASYAVSLLGPADGPVHFGDPAVGNGAFYAALLQVLPRSRIGSALGVDINSRQVEAARSRWGHRGLRVTRADYLHLERLPLRTLILANPPYLRHQDIPASYKKRLRERASVITHSIVDAKSGQYVYFLILSHHWMAENGVAAWLVPSGFIRAQYGRDVRRYLTEEVQLIRIHQFGAKDPQFENAKVLPVIVVFRRSTPDPSSTVTVTVGGTLDAPELTQRVSIGALREEESWTVALRGHTGPKATVSIGDLFSVNRGIATGANQFFILRRDKARELKLPDVALRPVLPKSRLLTSDVIERSGDGWPVVEPQLCVLDCELSETEIASKYPELDKYLAEGRALRVVDRNLVRHRRPWYRQERRRPAMFLCTYMGRGNASRLPLRFIWNKSDAIATNVYLMMYPKLALADVLDERPKAREELFLLLQGAASATVGQFSRMYAGGLQKIEPRELLKVGLPNVPEWLARVGRADNGPERLWRERDRPERQVL